MPDMKKSLILSALISLAMLCSCGKQDSTAEEQLAKRKAELDATQKTLNERMDALDERVNVLDGRVNVLIERDQTAANTRTIPTQVQSSTPSPAQLQTETENASQQIPTETRAYMDDELKMKAEKERERSVQTRPGLDREQNRQRKLEVSRRAASPPAETGSLTASPTPQ